MDELSVLSISLSIASLGIFFLFFASNDDDDQDGGKWLNHLKELINSKQIKHLIETYNLKSLHKCNLEK